MTPSSLTHEELARVLASLRLGVGASDLHGSLTGYLCAGGTAGADNWPAALEIDPGDQASLRHEALERLYRDCRAELDDPDLGFEPLLPAADAPVARRGDALVEWCRGFLGGVGLAGSPTGILSADANEVLADFGRIAASRFDYGDDEEDESALGEVLEFVRVGVLLLHAELTRPRASARHSVH
ncbi:MAG TPA: UPF0149 family protein [Rhodanobacteraceae bacterium]|jgi:uncharacterized protein YgfB (UPF0149 family)|nr:UPF0149 family protein [Rhodanobacteraceae bacterium]